MRSAELRATVSVKAMTVKTIAVASVSMPTNTNGSPNAKSTAASSASDAENTGQAVPRNDVEFPEDAEEPGQRERDDETVGKSRVHVAAEEERERAYADDAGDAVQGLHLDEQPEHADA